MVSKCKKGKYEAKCFKCKEEPPKYCEKCWTGIWVGRNKVFKRAVQKRGRCEMCGIRNPHVLTIHHLDKENHPYNPDKAVLLCLNCHIGIIHSGERNKKLNGD